MNKSLLVSAGLTGLLFLFGCPSGGPVDPCNPHGNPIDAVLCEQHRDVGSLPIQASERELCTRVMTDTLGVRPTEEQLVSRCLGRDYYDVVAALQADPLYRETQKRRWADKLQYNEYLIDVAWIKDLDNMVDALYRGTLDYNDFGVEVLSHPGFISRFIGYGQPELVADAAFEIFLGRPATRPEAFDVGNLFKPWMADSAFPEDSPTADAGGAAARPSPPAYVLYAPLVYLDTFACEAGVKPCRSELLGPAEVSINRNGRDYWVQVVDFTDEDWEALRVPGELIVNQPMYWEAQVDDVLERYLGYDFGTLQPEARQRLAAWFRARRDVRALERMVLTSWAYRQRAVEDPAQPLPDSIRYQRWAYGPTKLMIPETWLRSVGQITGTDPGNCDYRYPNLPDWYSNYDPSIDQVLEDTYPRNANGTVDPWFRNTAAAMGGCPNTFDYFSFSLRTRSTNMGLMTAVAQEEALVEMCLVRPVPGLVPDGVDPASTSPEDLKRTVAALLAKTQAEPPSNTLIDDVVARGIDGCPGCGAEALARDLCVGMAGGIQFIFY